jgi:cytochrome c peroxidase
MRSARFRLGTAAIAVLLMSEAPSRAQAPDLQALWREMFRRPAEVQARPDNPLTAEKIALGGRLFADPRLSGNGRRACASCHQPERAFTDGRRRALSLAGTPLRRNTPSLWNLAWSKHLFWDGRAPSLEAQVHGPIEAADEMGGDWPTITARLEQDAELRAQFRTAFPEEPAITSEIVSKALASYVRSLVSPPTRFDAWIEGDQRALSAAEVRGFRLFAGKAGCALCHVGWRFTDDRFHDIGLRSTDPGRGALPDGTPGRMAFKTPGLRDVARTAPYMHDGSLPTLDAVLAHYTGRFVARPTLAPNMRRDLRLTRAEKSDLIAFLRSLSSEESPADIKPAGLH